MYTCVFMSVHVFVPAFRWTCVCVCVVVWKHCQHRTGPSPEPPLHPGPSVSGGDTSHYFPSLNFQFFLDCGVCDQVSALRPAEAFEGKFLPGDEVPFSGPSGGDCVPSPTSVSEGAQSSQSWETWPVQRVPRPGERARVRGVPTFALGRLGSKSRLCQGCFAKRSLWAPSSVSLSPAL